MATDMEDDRGVDPGDQIACSGVGHVHVVHPQAPIRDLARLGEVSETTPAQVVDDLHVMAEVE